MFDVLQWKSLKKKEEPAQDHYYWPKRELSRQIKRRPPYQRQNAQELSAR
jgi:hypothetical protein